MTVLCLSGLAGAAWVLPFGLGLIPVVLIHMALLLTGYLVSHYLNTVTDSSHRATVLSFKGLAFNLGYGGIGLLYAGMLVVLRDTAQIPVTESAIFRASLPWLFGYGVGTGLLIVAIAGVAVRKASTGLKPW